MTRSALWTSALALGVAAASVFGADQPDKKLAPTTQPARRQLRNLREAPAKPRFQLIDRVWPARPGAAHVCLWNDDKLAAFSFTVDDNAAQDHDWWDQTARRYGFGVTWFVITGRVGTGAFWGTWKGWKRLKSAGHDIQSHTVDHIHPEKPGWKGIEWEYADAIKHIERNVPGQKVLTLAYPGGKNSKLNSRELAAKMYIAARGTRGTPNPANQIDYFNINAGGGLHVGGEKAPWADVQNVLDPNRYRRRYYRGWAVYLAHKADRKAVLKICEYLRQHRDEFWLGLFTDVARYGQERDTARLSVTSAGDEKITFTLSDDMDDELFDFPLTIKVRLPGRWSGVSATQSGKPVRARLVEHAGGKFALIKAVPDRGHVLLTPKAK